MRERDELLELLNEAYDECIEEGEYDEESLNSFVNKVIRKYDREY